jgi:hypothetical protein
LAKHSDIKLRVKNVISWKRKGREEDKIKIDAREKYREDER